jgi:hypothetical protein
MAKYFKQRLDGLGNGVSPPVESLNGLQLLRRGPVEAMLRAQDHVPALSRRLVASGGLRGSETWFTPDTDPEALAGTHPQPTTRRLIGAGCVDLTPGCMLRAWVCAVPSGETQISPINADASGAQGRCEVDVIWTDATGATVTTTHGVQLPASEEQYGAEPSPMFANLYEYELHIKPPGTHQVAELRRWCQHVNVDVRIYAVGGARIVDANVHEYPNAVAFEADDAGSQWTSHVYAGFRPNGPAAGLSHPYQRFSETSPDGDPRGGTWHVSDVHHAQMARLGPILFSWCAARESDGSEDVTTASASLVALEGGGSTTFDLTEPGLPCGTGGYARRQSSNSAYVLRGRVAAIPVIVRVLARSSTSNGTVRVQTRYDSYIDVSIPDNTLNWKCTNEWLEVGITPDDTSALLVQLWHLRSTVAAVTVHYAGGYTPTDA